MASVADISYTVTVKTTKTTTTKMFKVAGKAEIIRSQQKDEYYLTYLRKMSADVVHSLLGARAWITWRRELDLAADLGYFCLTTLSGKYKNSQYINMIEFVAHLAQKSIPV
ncbi:hypothetical protein DPMN_155800 [Dreissena polymorpha]|uniref:RING-type E3 ubiquitin transferase n=1 Tax=Dreissena polymorpha TaxID=45954 RepID=A0A9D4J867_DREPO|nr:hypothetical protein DPMN_155800 [Dreissena polymorpha]